MRRSLYFIFQNLILAGAQFSYMALVSRVFSPNDFAYFMVEFSLISLLTTIGSAGFSQIVFSGHSEFKGFIRYQLAQALSSGLLLVLIGFCVVEPWYLCWQLDQSWLAMGSPLIVLCLTPSFNFCSSVIRANYSTLTSISIQTGSFLTGYLTATVLCLQTTNPIFLFAAQSLSQLLVILAYLILGRKEIAQNSESGSNRLTLHYVRRARLLAGISYLSTNIFRWMTSVTLGPIFLGQLNRSEALTVGPIGLFQNAYTTTVSSEGNRGVKISSQSLEHSSYVAQIYAFVVLTGCYFGSFLIGPITLFVFGDKWLIAAKLASLLILAWGAMSVFSVQSFIFEARSDWKKAFTVQFFALGAAIFGTWILLLSHDIYLATLWFSILNYGTAIALVIVFSTKGPWKDFTKLNTNFEKLTLLLVCACTLSLAFISASGQGDDKITYCFSIFGILSSGSYFLVHSKKI